MPFSSVVTARDVSSSRFWTRSSRKTALTVPVPHLSGGLKGGYLNGNIEKSLCCEYAHKDSSSVLFLGQLLSHRRRYLGSTTPCEIPCCRLVHLVYKGAFSIDSYNPEPCFSAARKAHMQDKQAFKFCVVESHIMISPRFITWHPTSSGTYIRGI